MRAPLPTTSVFFQSHAISTVLAMSHSALCLLCLCLPSAAWKVWAFRLVLPSLISSLAWTLLQLLLFLLCPWACRLSFLPCWPIGLIISFLGFPRPIYFTFTSCCAYGPIGCHPCHVGPLGLLPLSLGFFNPFTLLLPLVVPMGLLAIIPTMLAHWAYYLFP